MKLSRYVRIAALGAALLAVSAACVLFTPPRGPLKFDPPTLPDAQVGAPYDVLLTVSGNVTPTFIFSAAPETLPPGLTLEKLENQDVARLHGTPTQAGTFTLKVYAYCYGTNVSGQQGETEYTLTVK